MGKLGTGILVLLLGIAIGALGAMKLAGGALVGTGAGVGIVTGLCMMIERGKASGILTDEQVVTILKRAATDFGAAVPEGTDISAPDCAAVMAMLKPAV
jgi:hypothetical protein